MPGKHTGLLVVEKPKKAGKRNVAIRSQVVTVRKNKRRIVYGKASRPAQVMSNFAPLKVVAKALHRGVERGQGLGASPSS